MLTPWCDLLQISYPFSNFFRAGFIQSESPLTFWFVFSFTSLSLCSLYLLCDLLSQCLGYQGQSLSKGNCKVGKGTATCAGMESPEWYEGCPRGTLNRAQREGSSLPSSPASHTQPIFYPERNQKEIQLKKQGKNTPQTKG